MRISGKHIGNLVNFNTDDIASAYIAKYYNLCLQLE